MGTEKRVSRTGYSRCLLARLSIRAQSPHSPSPLIISKMPTHGSEASSGASWFLVVRCCPVRGFWAKFSNAQMHFFFFFSCCFLTGDTLLALRHARQFFTLFLRLLFFSLAPDKAAISRDSQLLAAYDWCTLDDYITLYDFSNCSGRDLARSRHSGPLPYPLALSVALFPSVGFCRWTHL